LAETRACSEYGNGLGHGGCSFELSNGLRYRRLGRNRLENGILP